MSLEQRLKAEALLSTMCPEMIPTYLSFLAQTDPFPKLRFREEAQQVSSTVWRKSLTESKVSKDFIELAIRLVKYLRLPVVHQTKEYFQHVSFAHVHNKVRKTIC